MAFALLNAPVQVEFAWNVLFLFKSGFVKKGEHCWESHLPYAFTFHPVVSDSSQVSTFSEDVAPSWGGGIWNSGRCTAPRLPGLELECSLFKY